MFCKHLCDCLSFRIANRFVFQEFHNWMAPKSPYPHLLLNFAFKPYGGNCKDDLLNVKCLSVYNYQGMRRLNMSMVSCPKIA